MLSYYLLKCTKPLILYFKSLAFCHFPWRLKFTPREEICYTFVDGIRKCFLKACLLECQDLLTGKFYRRHKDFGKFEMSKATEQTTQNDILEGNLVKHKHSEKQKFRFLLAALFCAWWRVCLSNASCLNVGFCFTKNYFLVWDFYYKTSFLYLFLICFSLYTLSDPRKCKFPFSTSLTSFSFAPLILVCHNNAKFLFIKFFSWILRY